MLRFIKFVKDAMLAIPVTLILVPISRAMSFINYFNKIIIWIWKNKSHVVFHDFYSPLRDYNKRYALYQYILERYALGGEGICYLEFGVASGASFRWWLAKNTNAHSRFFGFDTFQGLPESWGTFHKGSMAFAKPHIDDPRASFVSGLFQDVLRPFLLNHETVLRNASRRIVHLDADLYSSTLFSLSQLWPFLKSGDLIFFDEFTVPMHEFRAYNDFINVYYIDLKPVGAVNNFYQTCFEVV